MNWKRLTPLITLMWFGHAWASDASQTISQGEYLAQAGDCSACHTSKEGKPFAGGLKMATPLGAIYSTNITPDRKYGIGNYSYDQFATALREGVAKDGHHLYPAMPYTSFAKINDQDMRALYNYFMREVQAVDQPNKDSDIPWPLNMRWPLAAWNWVFHDDSDYQPTMTMSSAWNRGAYLVQGLGHCGACHTPRGLVFQEKALDQSDGNYLTGATLDGWHAPNLNGNLRTGLGSWKIEEIIAFLKQGHTENTAAFGPMAEVVEKSTQHLSDDDLKAIAIYLKGLSASNPNETAAAIDPATVEALVKGDTTQTGAQEYLDNCAACHRLDGKGYRNTFPALAQNTALLVDDPSALINIVLQGGHSPVTQQAVAGLAMPAFGWRLDNQQAADVVTFIRNGWGNQAPAVTAEQVKKVRDAASSAKP